MKDWQKRKEVQKTKKPINDSRNERNNNDDVDDADDYNDDNNQQIEILLLRDETN